MKIGVYISCSTPVWGGAYTFENEIMNSLLKLRNESKHTFVLLSKEDCRTAKKIPEHIEIVSLNCNVIDKLLIKLNNFVKYLFAGININFSASYENKLFKKQILSADIDMIWSLSQSSPTMELPYIVTVWDLQHRVQPFFPEVSRGGIWDDRENNFNTILKRASIIVTGTEAGKAEIERFYHVSSERIKTIPFPTPAFSLSENCMDNMKVQDKYNIPDKYLFYPAQFWSHKNHAGLLLALKLLKEKDNIIISVVFTGTDKGNLQYIKNLADQLTIKDQTFFLNFVPQQDLIALYKNAFALIYLSFFGPDNIPPLEAFGLGCPVIASKVSGSEEQLGDAAILVDPRNEDDIAGAVKMLLEDPELREKLLKLGYERANKYTTDDYVQDMLSVIDEFEPMRRCWSNSETRT